MRALVVGYGSIGSRHARVLTEIGCEVSLVTSQRIEKYASFSTIEDALKTNSFNQIVVANPTNLHYETLKKILAFNFNGTVLVEKPLFSGIEKLETENKNIYVAYNLRFHELFQTVRNLLQDDELVSFSVQVGSYLPMWRKNTDYRNCYSAKKECGGGVLRDLSHELDYTLAFCGNGVEVSAIGGQYSALEINTDDVYSIIMRCEKCPVVTIQLDYLNRVPTRTVLIHTKKQNTILLDLIQGDLIYNGETKCQVKEGIQKTYTTQHELLLKSDFTQFCDYKQGLVVMKLINAIEQAAVEKKWIVL